MELKEEVKAVEWSGSPAEELYESGRKQASGGRPWWPARSARAAALWWTSLQREVAESVRLEILELLVVVDRSGDSWTRRIEWRRVELRAAVARST
jgi:glutathione S-transferase